MSERLANGASQVDTPQKKEPQAPVVQEKSQDERLTAAQLLARTVPYWVLNRATSPGSRMS